jgi:hypothetical protein
MRKIQKKKVKTKKVDRKLEWLSKPTTYTPTHKLDGRRKAGADTGLFGNSKPILPLKPINPNESNSKIEEIKKRKLEEKLRKTARTMSNIKKSI